MHDRGKFWSSPPDWRAAALSSSGVCVASARDSGTLWLVSGDLAAFLAERQGKPPILGPRDTCGDGAYALRLAPDRVLYVSPVPETAAEGWSSKGYAVSDISKGMLLIDLVGPSGGSVLAAGTGYDLASTDQRPQESAQLLIAGHRIGLCRRKDGWRLHVERPIAPALWHWLETAGGLAREKGAS